MLNSEQTKSDTKVFLVKIFLTSSPKECITARNCTSSAMSPGRCNKQGVCKVYTCARLLFTAKLHHMYFHHKSSNGGHSRTYLEESKLDWRVLKLLLESKIFHHKVAFKIFKHVKKISFCGFHCLHCIFPSMH